MMRDENTLALFDESAGTVAIEGRVEEIYVAGARRFARMFLAVTEGWVDDGEPTIEDVAAHWATINDEAVHSIPVDLMDWSATFLRHLGS